MRFTSRGFAAVTVGLVSAVALAGCSGNSNKPTVLPSLQTTTASPAAATSPAPAPVQTTPAAAATTGVPAPTTAAPTTTALPATARSHPDASVASSVLDAVGSYYKTVDASLKNANLLPKWRSLFTGTCAVCLGDYNAVEKELTAGARYEGGGYQLKHAEVANASPDGALVNIAFISPAGKVYDKNNKLVDAVGTSKLRKASVSLENQFGTWYVSAVSYQGPT